MCRIAYIDDSFNDRSLALEEGFEVFEPDDYRFAKSCDIILIDIMIGSMELLKEIVEYFKPIKAIVMVSGLPAMAAFYEVDEFPVLRKPIIKKMVIDALNE